MKIYLTINDLQKLSEGKTLRSAEGELFKPSDKVKKICGSMLNYGSLLDIYKPVLESNWQVTSIYLQKVETRRRRRKTF